MNENILLKTIMNEVNFKEQKYLRMYNINNENEQKGTLINLKVFLKENEFAYTPFYYENSDNKELVDRLLSTNVSDDVLLNIEDIKRCLASFDKYIELTYDIVEKTSKSIFENINVFLYKEYMGVFYVILKREYEYFIYEVRLEKSGKLSFLYLENNIVDFIIRRDFSKFIDITSEIYLKVSDDRYVIITNIENKQYFVEVKLSDTNYSLESIKCNPFILDENKDKKVPIEQINKKIENIIFDKISK